MTTREKVFVAVGAFALLVYLTRKKVVVYSKKTMGKIDTFISKNREAAAIVGREFNLPVWLIITQGGHESAFGESALSLKANNLFGFTGQTWAKEGKPTVAMPTREFLKGVWVAVTRPFRAYPSVADSMRDYARLLTTQPRYALAVAAARAGNVQGTWDALGKSGYATDPTYGEKLAGVYSVVKTLLA